MEINVAKSEIHAIRGSVNVIANFIDWIEPSDDDGTDYKKTAKSSVEKLIKNLENLNDLIEKSTKA